MQRFPSPSSPSTRKPVTLPGISRPTLAIVSVTTVCYWWGLPKVNRRMRRAAPGRPTHNQTRLQICCLSLQTLTTTVEVGRLARHGMARYREARPTKMARSSPGRNLTASPRAPWGLRSRRVAHLATLFTLPSTEAGWRDGQGTGNYDIAISSQHGILKKSHLRDIAPPGPCLQGRCQYARQCGIRALCRRVYDHNEFWLRGEPRQRFTIPLGPALVRPGSRYWKQLYSHVGPVCLVLFFRDERPFIAGQ